MFVQLYIFFIFFIITLLPDGVFINANKNSTCLFVQCIFKRCRERCYISKCEKTTTKSRNAFVFETFIFPSTRCIVNYRKQQPKKHSILSLEIHVLNKTGEKSILIRLDLKKLFQITLPIILSKTIVE